MVDTVDMTGSTGVEGSPITAATASATSAHVTSKAGAGSTTGSSAGVAEGVGGCDAVRVTTGSGVGAQPTSAKSTAVPNTKYRG
ncbi:hypothetical protein GCM10009651_26010 [Microbacterium natoriense]